MTFDWSHLQTFVAVAEEGSLSAAARALGGSQPTMGRHIAALQDALGVRLFARRTGGLELTPTGLELLHHAGGMAGAAQRLALSAAGREESLAGSIRITASDIVAMQAHDVGNAERCRAQQIVLQSQAVAVAQRELQHGLDALARQQRGGREA